MVVVGSWGEKVVRKVGLGRSAAGAGGEMVGVGGGFGLDVFNWTGEDKSAQELRRARVQEAQVARHFQKSTRGYSSRETRSTMWV